jgi:uncharacterized protein YkwD
MRQRRLLVATILAGIALTVACSDAPTDRLTRGDDPYGAGGTDPYSAPVDEAGDPVVSSTPWGEGDGEGDPGAPPDAGSKDASTSTDASTVDASTSSSSSSSSTGGSSSGTSGTTSSTSSSGGTAGTCSVTRTGATGPEAGGTIPVCCAPTTTQKTAITEVFTLLNQYRAQKGKAALTYDPKLEAAVQGHCEHMAKHGFFDHYAPETVVKYPGDRAKLCGTTATGENLAAGQRSPTEVMNAWKNSSGHNANMLANHRRVGICRVGSYWGQLFGG